MITKSTSLTESQMLIWMGQSISPETPLYNMIFAFEINGGLEIDLFKEAFNVVVGESDVLRSVVLLEEDMPKLGYHSQIDNPLMVHDFSNESDPYRNYLEWVDENKGKFFGVGELLYQAVLFKIAEDTFVFYFNQHHLITDAWSTQNCYDALNRHYQSFIKGNGVSNDKPSSYHEYARTRSFEHLEPVTPYWQWKQDKDQEPPALYGYTAKGNTSKATRIQFDLGEMRTEGLHQLARDENVRSWTPELALSNLFLTALSALVFKVGNREEFAVGVPFHNRTSAEEKRITGLLMGLLPVDINVEGEATLFSLYQYIKSESLDVIKHAMSGKPPIDLLRSFNVVMNFTPTIFEDFAGFPTECHWLLSGHSDPNHHIRLQIHDFNDTGSLKLVFDFINSAFDKERMEHIVQHFVHIVDAMIADINQTVRGLSITTEVEKQRIMEWNDTDRAYDPNETLLSKFEEQVGKNPEGTALWFKDRQLSYGELNEKANQVAHFLIGQGIQRNDIVAVSLERSMEMMVYLYGIIKAGAAYLPIDVATPQGRLNYILENAKIKVLVYNHDSLVPDSLGTTICYHHRDISPGISKLSTVKPNIATGPDDLAYVMYTSGSTGAPKGVKCHHKGICNRLNWMDEAYPISGEDTLLQKTPITFDVSVWELFWPLQKGVQLVILEPEEHKNPERLIEVISNHQVTSIHFVPSMLNLFMAMDKVESCTSLERIFCSGEVLTPSSVKKVHDLLDVEIYNLYGPTEASVDVSHWHCKKGADHNGIPIGYPVANTQLYILDEAMNFSPIGAVGELYIAGTQVAHGYLNNRMLTEERFVKNSFSPDQTARMYRTGDLARYREDGALDYLGRIDTQVKLRGQRIELGEIEKTLEKHGGVTQAVVQLAKTKSEEEYLVAYYTGEKVGEKELVGVLQPLLPSYMIPSFYVHLEQFKLSPNGKVDRKSIPKHSVESAGEVADYEAPTNEFEKIIADTWIEVLQNNRVGLHENFIRLGGNSLNAMAITSRLKAAFELELPLTLVFEYPTVKSYAAYVEQRIIELLSN